MPFGPEGSVAMAGDVLLDFRMEEMLNPVREKFQVALLQMTGSGEGRVRQAVEHVRSGMVLVVDLPALASRNGSFEIPPSTTPQYHQYLSRRLQTHIGLV